YAPPRDATAPPSKTALQRTRSTAMPTDAAASGFSPTDRTRRPNGVLASVHETANSERIPTSTKGFASDARIAPEPDVPLAPAPLNQSNPGMRGELDEE